MNNASRMRGGGFLRIALTLMTVAAAVVAGQFFWHRYMVEPWTRDGRVRAEVVNIASDVSGRIVDLKVMDNQFVHKDDILFAIDQDTYRLALAQAEGTLESLHQDWLRKQSEADRRNKLAGKSVVSAEEWQAAQFAASAARAAYQQGVAARDLAKLNLARTVVRSPVNGFITNLHLRVGSYASIGQTQVSIVDSDSFWVAGYFEETKLSHIHENDAVSIELMGVETALAGHVETISHGIADRNSGASDQGLANVDPVFTWVRLAQRIPVRVRIDQIPEGVRIVSGMTCTLSIKQQKGHDHHSLAGISAK